MRGLFLSNQAEYFQEISLFFQPSVPWMNVIGTDTKLVLLYRMSGTLQYTYLHDETVKWNLKE